MKFWRVFDIEIIKLKEGEHEFSFDIGDDFFVHFEANDIIEKGNLKARVILDKQVNLLEATFDIEGTVELTCDRSLEKFDHPLSIEQKIRYKYGPEEQEINEEIIMITRDTPSINMAQLFYEFIILALPAKKIHPDYINELDEDDLDSQGQLVYWSDEPDDSSPTSNTPSEDDSEDHTDPRWEALRKLKKKD